jgi:hypothetical protein
VRSPRARVQGRERLRQARDLELEEPLRPVDVLELVRTELASRVREEHLPAVRNGGDACGAVDAETDISLLADDRLTGVEPHADTQRKDVRAGVAVPRTSLWPGG